jgi:hypothetical protein
MWEIQVSQGGIPYKRKNSLKLVQLGYPGWLTLGLAAYKQPKTGKFGNCAPEISKI